MVVDVSVFADYYLLYPGRRWRHERARRLLDALSRRGLPVYEPFIFEVELRGVLVRGLPPTKVLEIVNVTLDYVNIVPEEPLHGRAAEVALLTGSRAVDAYYVATALLAGGALVTSDRVMAANARRVGVEAYYILDDDEYSVLLKGLQA